MNIITIELPKEPRLACARAAQAASVLADKMELLHDAIEDADLSATTVSHLPRLADILRELGNDGNFLAERFGDE